MQIPDEYILVSKVEYEQLLKDNAEAWKNNLSPNFLVYNNATDEFESVSSTERTNLRNAVSVLLPYQHGYCFYCKKKINTN